MKQADGVRLYKKRLALSNKRLDVREVPDPYYGNVQGFERVLDLCEAGGNGLIAYCQATP